MVMHLHEFSSGKTRAAIRGVARHGEVKRWGVRFNSWVIAFKISDSGSSLLMFMYT